MKKKNKTILLISILAIILIGVIGVAYAYSGLFTGGNQQLVLGDIYMHYNETNELTLENMMPSESYDTSKYFEFTIDGKNTYNKDIYYEIVLNHGDIHATRETRIKDNLLKFTLVEIKDNTETIVVNGVSYDEINATRIWVNTIPKNTTSDVNITYRLYMWVSSETKIGNTSGVDYDMTTWNDDVYASIKVNVIGDFESKSAGPPTAANDIIAKLGTDGLVAINEDGGLYTGEGTIREYRYSGLDVNNYVYFNCKDSDGTYDYGNENYNYASNCETWRIVGIFEEDGEQVVKIMRNTKLKTDELPETYIVDGTTYLIERESYGRVYWNKPDTLKSTNYSDWTTAGLQYFLNTESDTNGTVGYMSTLTTSAEELIRTTTYKLGNVSEGLTTKVMYTSERNIESSNIHSGNYGTWSGKVGLLYPSDYGYSVNNAYWDVTTASSGYATAQSDGVIPKNTSWMNANHNYNEWFLSPSPVATVTVLGFDYDGYIDGYSVNIMITLEYGNFIRPCLYLVSTAKILKGTGESTNPYVVIA